MRKILFSFLLLAASLQAKTFGYGDFHAMAGCPMAGVGVRSQNGSHALDLSANVCVWPTPTIFHVKLLYIAYPQGEGLYFGGGIGVVNASAYIDDFTGSFDGSIGYQWETSRSHPLFFEVSGMFPFDENFGEGWMRVWPGLTFGVGF